MNLYYKDIPSDTLFDYEGFYSRMAEQMPNNAIIAEVGLADGRSMIFLASILMHLGKSFTLYAIDNFDYGGQYQKNVIEGHIASSGVKNVKLIEASSLDASCMFEDNYFDFVYIDASHKYEQTKADILLWERKVKEGAILAGHDYLSEENEGVGRADREMIVAEKLRTEDTDRGHGLWWTVKEKILSVNEINKLIAEKDERITELNHRVLSLLKITK